MVYLCHASEGWHPVTAPQRMSNFIGGFIQVAMQGEDPPAYVIRADIRSYYRSIPHYKLLDNVRQAFDDPKVQAMLEEAIINSIDTP